LAGVLNILPLFAVMALGFAGARAGLLPPGFVGPANRLVFFVAVPALLFRALAQAPVSASWQPAAAGAAVAAQLLAWGLALAASRRLPAGASRARRASWVHCAVHGNQGLVGLVVVLYALGGGGLAAAGLVATAIIVTQNILAVLTLARWGEGGRAGGGGLRNLATNPVILSVLAGLAFALLGAPLPQMADRTLELVASLAPPLALLIVGAQLSRTRLGGGWGPVLAGQAVKLAVMPALGAAILGLWGVEGLAREAAVVLLASPTATMAVVLAGELGGDQGFSSQAVSVSHALALAGYSLWLGVLSL
jgi:predicted permease